MHKNISMSRAVVAAVLLTGLVAGSGCSWFRKGNKLYTGSAETRPLEVPPDLDLPRSEGALASAAAPASATAPAAPVAGVSNGFTTPGTRDDIFNKVGDALGKTEGVTVASRAQLLGAFDVNYGGSNFLIRVSAVEAGAYVAAVDPRGVPATGEAPVKLIAALKAAIGGN